MQIWPIEQMVERLQDEKVLGRLIAPKQNAAGPDVRENLIEAVANEVMIEAFGAPNVFSRKRAKSILGLSESPFPATKIPDIVVLAGGAFHFCDLKANRVDYSRFDNVFESHSFRGYLESTGDGMAIPWEVEQDLIKLYLYKRLSSQVGSCLFLMLDAYQGSGRSWTDVFRNRSTFVETMHTRLVRDLADQILGVTRISELVASPHVKARLILIEIHK